MQQARPVDYISFGGGQQSTALLVLAATGRITAKTFLFANVGDDSELPATLCYLEEHAKPYAARHGLELVELRRIMKHRLATRGQERTLWQQLNQPGSKSIDIPVRMANGAPGNRNCTKTFKIDLVAEELARRGATAENPAIVGMGISLDEIERANNRSPVPHERVVYPLLDLGLRRTDCQRIIRKAGLPLPPKSACFFCPFHRPEDWHTQRRTEPELFEKSCQLEETLNGRRADLGKDPVYLTRFNKPLREAIPAGVDLLPGFDEDEGCDSGWCMT
ncbi:phosphoadenosine phosphosulfate reductase [Streptomyces sp. NPDC057963]|uniref:phosphoadenosine phosphosulfate reductase n=1 Tax=Streptomyces sp. NPDC057963 TaxID=3346290 RepID=UPI0036EEABA4